MAFGKEAATIDDLQSLLEHNFTPEHMTEENRFACDTCTSLCEAQKRVHMSHAPDNILLALKRFAI